MQSVQKGTTLKTQHRWLVFVGVLLCAMELASRFLFGNYAQSALVEKVDDPALCMVLGRNRDLTYTGWYRRVPQTQMQSDGFGARGFRNYVDYSIKNQEVNHIFMLGDSFTYGQGVEREEALPALVEESLGTSYRVWNFGVPGRNFYQMSADVERLLENTTLPKPKLLLVNLFINDFHEAPEQCMLTEATWKLPLMRMCHLCRWAILATSPSPQTLQKEEITEAVRKQIQDIERLGQQHQVPILFALLMDHHVHESFQPSLPPIYRIVQEESQHWIDLDEVWALLLMNESQYQIPGEYHWNVEGNQRLAQSYAQALHSSISTLFSSSGMRKQNFNSIRTMPNNP